MPNKTHKILDDVVDEQLNSIAAALAESEYATTQSVAQIAAGLLSPKEIVKNTDLINDHLIEGGEVLLDSPLRPHSTKQTRALRVSLSFDAAENHIRTSKKLSAFERDVVDAVTSLYYSNRSLTEKYAGDLTFSAASIYRIMYGIDKMTRMEKRNGTVYYRINIPPVAMQSIEAALDSLMVTRIDVDLDPSMLADTKISRALSSTVLPLVRVQASSYDGRTCKLYRLTSQPILYFYAALCGSLVSADVRLNRLPDCMSKTMHNAATRNVLANACFAAAADNVSCATVSYASVYAQRNATSTNQRARSRTAVLDILNYWVSDECNYIDRFEEYYSKGTKPAGVRIYFQSKHIAIFDHSLSDS